MNLDEATREFGRLKAAFPTMALDEEQAELLVRELALLHDATVLYEAVSNLIHREERFPTIARIRLAYRSVNDARHAQQQALEAAAPGGDSDVPEWVQVWWWNLHRSRQDREIANEERFPNCKVGERPPKRMRGFPQEHDPGDDPLTMDEYEQVRQAWIAAGSPEAHAWDIIPA